MHRIIAVSQPYAVTNPHDALLAEALMEGLLRNKKELIILGIILAFSIVDFALSERFFRREIIQQINETLKSQAAHIVEGYETYAQNQEILRAGIRADALELNRLHGEFLLKTMAQVHRENLRGEIDTEQLRDRIASLITHSEKNIGLKGMTIWEAYSHRNDLDKLIRDAVLEPGQTISYPENDPTEIFRANAMDIVIHGAMGKLRETYARAVYFPPLDAVVVFRETAGYDEDPVEQLFRRNQESLERNIMMIGATEDVIILQKNGYSLFSGRFQKNTDRRITRIFYDDHEDPESLSRKISGNHDVYRTLMVLTPDMVLQKRYCYIARDAVQDQYVVVSHPIEAIAQKEGLLRIISRLIGALNVIVVCLAAHILIARDNALQKEEAAHE